MIGKNIMFLRRRANLSQEALAEQIDVSRGESIPDVLHCDRIAEYFDLGLDDLLHTDLQTVPVPQKGRYVFGTVTVGEKGQIVIPVKARRVFGIKPGDSLMVLGDEDRGLALIRADFFLEVARQMQEGKIE